MHMQNCSESMLENQVRRTLSDDADALANDRSSLPCRRYPLSTRSRKTEESQNDKSIHELDKQRRRLEVEKEELQVILTSHWSQY